MDDSAFRHDCQVPDGISPSEPEGQNIARLLGLVGTLEYRSVLFFEPSRESVFDWHPRIYIVRRLDAERAEARHDKPDAIEPDLRVSPLMVVGNTEHVHRGMEQRVSQMGAPGVANCLSTLTRFGKPPKLMTLLNLVLHVERFPSHPGCTVKVSPARISNGADICKTSS